MSTITKTVLRSDEFSCPSCVSKIEAKLADLPGVVSAQVHFTTGRIEVEHVADETTVDDLVSAVDQVGYLAVPQAF
ncbi:MAG TPA: heavy metal-associated domain-containing protein [Acidimicrobiia bacterium]|jgi:copper chaperone CopZ|nr:heavy metal-associated domain-containing protein [Acidimicrobiia bacterium]